ncbi:MAG: DUF3047 domain-containing protein [Polyangia bacterium]
MSTSPPNRLAAPPDRAGSTHVRRGRFLTRAVLTLGLLGIGLAEVRPAAATEPVTVFDLSHEPDTPAGDPLQAWLKGRSGRWEVKFGTPAYFFLRDGSLHLLARPGPMAGSVLFWRLLKREDKVLLRVTAGGFRVHPQELRHLEVTMAPVQLVGKGADVTDPDRNDACFYLLVSFDGPRHSYQGQRIPDTVAYVWADGAWKVAGEVGKERKYGEFMRYIALGRGNDRPGQLRTLVRDVEADFRLAYPERAAAGVPDVIEVGLMIDSNTVKSEAESRVRSVRFLP